jgi:hypothetical protein
MSWVVNYYLIFSGGWGGEAFLSISRVLIGTFTRLKLSINFSFIFFICWDIYTSTELLNLSKGLYCTENVEVFSQNVSIFFQKYFFMNISYRYWYSNDFVVCHTILINWICFSVTDPLDFCTDPEPDPNHLQRLLKSTIFCSLYCRKNLSLIKSIVDQTQKLCEGETDYQNSWDSTV